MVSCSMYNNKALYLIEHRQGLVLVHRPRVQTDAASGPTQDPLPPLSSAADDVRLPHANVSLL